MTPRLLRLTLIRAVLHIVGIGAMFSALRFLPLADALAIAFVMPFISLLRSRRLAACCVGFIGTLLVIQPSFVAVGLPALLPLIVAIAFALFMLVTRHVAKEIDPIALQTTSGMFASVILGILFLATPDHFSSVMAIVTPTTHELWLLLLIGIIGTIAHLLMTWSLRFAPSATVAPMQYLEIPIATLIGWMGLSRTTNTFARLMERPHVPLV